MLCNKSKVAIINRIKPSKANHTHKKAEPSRIQPFLIHAAYLHIYTYTISNQNHLNILLIAFATEASTLVTVFTTATIVFTTGITIIGSSVPGLSGSS